MTDASLPPLINRQRIIAAVLMLLECAVLCLLARAYVLPGLLLAATVYGLLTRWRITMHRKLGFNLLVMLWLLLLAQYGLLPANKRYTDIFAGQQLAYLLAQYLTCVQASYFYVLRRDNLVPSSFVVLGVAALASLSIVSLNHSYERVALQALLVTFVLVALLFWESGRRYVAGSTPSDARLGARDARPQPPPTRSRGRTLLRVLVLILVGTSGWGTAWLMARYETKLDNWVTANLLDFEKPITNVGFAETSRIGAVRFNQQQAANTIALRVRSQSEPGYFRGKAYDYYFDREWRFAPNNLPVERLSSVPAGLSAVEQDGSLFKTGTTPPLPTDVMTVTPAAGLGGIYFAPLGTSYLQTIRGTVLRDQYDVLRNDEQWTSGQFKLFVGPLTETKSAPRAVSPPSEISNSRSEIKPSNDLLFVPRSIHEDDGVRALSDRLFRGSMTTRQKIAAVETYFSSYQYSLSAQPPADRDPLGWFLTERPAAHCEYFGSGTVMLLRLAGVPSRYVTGFVVDEQNSISGEYVARQKDAHAWAEARLDDGQWELIETTPGSGQPSNNGDADRSDWSEWIESMWLKWKHALIERGLDSLLREGLIGVLGFLVKAGIVLALLVGGVVGFRRYRRSRGHRPARLYAAHELDEFLQQADRDIARVFRPRAAAETLSQYAAALDEHARQAGNSECAAVANWYRDFERLRFQRPSDAASVELKSLPLSGCERNVG